MLISVVVCEQYTDRYDNINVDEILANRRLLMPYLKCLLDQGRCTPEGKEIKCESKLQSLLNPTSARSGLVLESIVFLYLPYIC